METQETRSERATLTVTPSEKRAIKAVALVRGTDEANLLRTKLIADIVAEYERMGEALAVGAA